jgi:hypothetical protein
MPGLLYDSQLVVGLFGLFAGVLMTAPERCVAEAKGSATVHAPLTGSVCGMLPSWDKGPTTAETRC